MAVQDIGENDPLEKAAEEDPRNFEFDMRNYLSISGYYKDLKKSADINPDNILELEDTALFLDANTQFSLTYLEDYLFKADVGYRWSPGSSAQSDRDTHFITNEYFFDLYLAQLAYLRGGKKRETWGVGWTFSPIDNIIEFPKNKLDPSESKEGKYLAMTVVPLGNSSLSLVYFPQVDFDLTTETGQSGIPNKITLDDGTIGLRGSFLLWDTDVSPIFYRTDKIPDLMKNYYGLTLTRYWLDLGAYVEMEGHEGNDLERVQKNSEGVYSFPVGDDLVNLHKDDDDIFVNFALGTNYTFSDDSKITLEYFRNNEGYNDNEFDEFVDSVKSEAKIYRDIHEESSMLKLLKANQLLEDRIRKNYLSFSFDRPNTFDDFFPHLGIILGLDDYSALINGAITYNVRDDTSISLDARGYLGDSDTEFGMKPENFRLFMKVKYFF